MKRFVILFLMLPALSLPALAGSTITVTHGQTPDPTYLDLGPAGESIGDQRIFEFGGKTTDSEAVVMDWVMTTTGQTAGTEGIENRMTSAVFSFGNGTSDRILVQGIGVYPANGSTFKPDTRLERAIIGGTGRYAGARGTVLTTHLEDGTWQHVFSIQ